MLQKKQTAVVLTLLLLVLMLPFSVFAADDDVNVTLTLSKNTAAAGDSITASGTASSSTWVTIKVMDSEQVIIVFDSTKSGTDGKYSCTFIIPQAANRPLTVTAGYGKNVNTKTITNDTGEDAVQESPGSINDSGEDHTVYNENVLKSLREPTSEQQDKGRLPLSSSAVSATASSPCILTTGDGVSLTVPPGALRSRTGEVQFEVTLGTVTAPPRAEPATVVLDPLRYQRRFCVQGQTEKPFYFDAPVTISFPVTVEDLPSGTEIGQLAVYRWNEEKGDWIKIGGVYDSTYSRICVPVYHFSTYAVMSDTSTVPDRLAGEDRFETAIKIAEQGWKAGATHVVLANGYSFPDALAACPLAYKYNAPILLTHASVLTPSTKKEIHKLNPESITIIGGTGAVSQAIEDSLSNIYGKENVARYGGNNRYETAAAIASALGTSGQAIIANGENGHYADALSISSYAAYKGIPILFTAAVSLPAATSEALTSHEVTAAIVAGGEMAVSEAVCAELPVPVRYGGADRYATATAIAGGLQLNLKQTYVVTGLDFPDALVAGNLAAYTLSPLIMVDRGLPEATRVFLNNNPVNSVIVIGGTGAVDAAQYEAVKSAL